MRAVRQTDTHILTEEKRYMLRAAQLTHR